MTRAKAIRIFCIECAGDSAQEVTLCGIKDCPIWEYRLGCGMKTDAYRLRVKGAWERDGEVAKAAEDFFTQISKIYRYRIAEPENKVSTTEKTLDFWLSKATREPVPAKRRGSQGKAAGGGKS